MADSTTKVYGETTWAIALVEAVNSSAGTAGDGINVAFTSTTPTNKYVYLFSNKVKKGTKSKDETQHMVKARSRTTKLGTVLITATISQAIVVGHSVVDLNALDDQLDEWMISGNAQTAVKAVYLVVKMDVSGNDRYKTFRNAGVKQNWLKCEIKSYTSELTNERILVNLQLEESDT